MPSYLFASPLRPYQLSRLCAERLKWLKNGDTGSRQLGIAWLPFLYLHLLDMSRALFAYRTGYPALEEDPEARRTYKKLRQLDGNEWTPLWVRHASALCLNWTLHSAHTIRELFEERGLQSPVTNYGDIDATQPGRMAEQLSSITPHSDCDVLLHATLLHASALLVTADAILGPTSVAPASAKPLWKHLSRQKSLLARMEATMSAFGADAGSVLRDVAEIWLADAD